MNDLSAPEFHLAKESPEEKLARLLWGAHRHMRAGVRHAMVHLSQDSLAAVAALAEVDTLYGIDEVAERCLFEYLEEHQSEAPAFLLVGEFESGEAIPFGNGEPRFRVLCDPIDGTRLIMHDKASAWILSGIFPEKGDATRLAEAIFALQTEIPLLKHLYAETFWASAGRGAHQLVENLLTHETRISAWRTSAADDLRHSFISFVKLFPRGKSMIVALEEDFLQTALGEEASAPAAIFEDQHLSTSGQLYSLARGQTKLVVDIRPDLNRIWRSRNEPTGLCAHPYDLCTWLIAHEAGVVIWSTTGAPFDGPATASAEVGWIGFTNRTLAERYGQDLLEAMRRRGMI